MTNTNNNNESATITLRATGEHVALVCGLDSDATASVWIYFVADPDRDALVTREELTGLI